MSNFIEKKSLFECFYDLELYKCSFCIFSSNSLVLLVEHKQGSHQLKVTKNEALEAASASESASNNIQQHQNIPDTNSFQDTIKYFECAQCDYKCKLKGTLERHKTDVHYIDGQGDWLYCNGCSFKTRDAYSLRRHKRWAKHEKNPLHKCHHCDYKGLTESALMKHVEDTHQHKKKVKHKCDQCDYKSTSKMQLMRHQMRVHQVQETVQINWFACDRCDFGTRSATTFKYHRLHHMYEDRAEWFECTQCDYRTDEERIWRRHVNIHTKRPLQQQTRDSV